MMIPGAHKPPADVDCTHETVDSSPHVFFWENKLAWRCHQCKRLWSSDRDGTNFKRLVLGPNGLPERAN